TRPAGPPAGAPRPPAGAGVGAEATTLPLSGLDAPQVGLLLAGVTGADPDPRWAPACTAGPAATRSSSSRWAGCWPPTRGRPPSPTGSATRSGAGWPPSATPASGCWMAGAVDGSDPRPAGGVAPPRPAAPAPGRFPPALSGGVLYARLAPPARARLHLEAAAALE